MLLRADRTALTLSSSSRQHPLQLRILVNELMLQRAAHVRNPQQIQQVSCDSVQQAEDVVQHFFGGGLDGHDPAYAGPGHEADELHGVAQVHWHSMSQTKSQK
jgi:hypothetical protein